MRKLTTVFIVIVTTMMLFACESGLSDEDLEQIAQTIALIDLAEANNQQAIDEALNAFDNLKEIAKYDVSNYTKLFYLTAEDPVCFTIGSHTEFSQEAIDEYLGKSIQIESIHDIPSKMNMIDFDDTSFEDVDLSIFESQTVLVTIEPTYWVFNENDEVFSYKHYTSGLWLVFYKEPQLTFPDASYFGFRFIVLDTIYPITLLPRYQVFCTSDPLFKPSNE